LSATVNLVKQPGQVTLMGMVFSVRAAGREVNRQEI
jgi:hypothetical protein